jgi:phosphoglycerate dehydrogenase-like enzyme
MQPHLGASTKENLARIGVIVVRLLEEYSAGKHE